MELGEIARLAVRGKVSRRAFIQFAIAGGLTASAAQVVLSRAAAASPKKGGTLRLGIAGGSSTDSLVPGTLNDDGARIVSWVYRSSLTEIDNNGQLTGDLAEG